MYHDSLTCIKHDIYQCHADVHSNMDGWEMCVFGTGTKENTMHQYPGTSTSRMQYSAMYDVYYLVAKGRQMVVDMIYTYMVTN